MVFGVFLVVFFVVVLWGSVVDKCCEEVLWRSLVVKCCREVL